MRYLHVSLLVTSALYQESVVLVTFLQPKVSM